MSPFTESRTVSTQVGALHVELSGDGPPVVCWPSLYCDARTLDPLVSDLARTHRVMVIDGPGHGRSGSSGPRTSLDDCADAAIEVLDAIGIQRAAWIGAAWGGHVGIQVARRHRDRIRGLIVINTPMASWRGSRLALMRLTYALLWLFGPRSFVASLIADKMIAGTAAPDRIAMVAAVATALRRCERRSLLPVVRAAMFQRENLVPVLSDVTVPVMFLTGANDPLFHVEEARVQAAKIPDCHFVVVERSAHQSVLEAPAQVLPVVHQALAVWAPA